MEKCGPRMQIGNHIHIPRSAKECEGMSLHIPKWISKFLKSNLRGQNSLDRIIQYAIGKLLRRKCQKWVCMIHLNAYKISYDIKKGLELVSI